MQVHHIKVSLLHENTYFVVGKNNDTVVIDPGSDFEILSSFAENNNLNIKAVLLTHAHYDHISASVDMSKKFNVPIYIHPEEEKVLTDNEVNYSAHYGYEFNITEYKFLDSDKFVFGDNELQIIFTPGHTPGGVCYYSKDDGFLICGDMIFFGTVGRTDLLLGDQAAMNKSLLKLAALPNETIVYSGHGRETTIGREKMRNPHIAGILNG